MKAAYLFLKKQGVTISFIVGALLSMISIGVIIAGFPEGATMGELHLTNIFNPALNISYTMIVVGALLAIIGPAIYTVMNFKESVRGLIAIAVLIVMYFVSVAMGATPNVEELTFFRGVDNEHLTGETVAYIDGLLIFTGIMIFLTMASLVFMMVWGLLKQR